MRRSINITAITVLLLFFPMVVSAQGPKAGHRMSRGQFSPLEELGLSAHQREEAGKAEAIYKDPIFNLRQDLMVKHIELEGLLRDPDAPEATIRAKAGEIEAIQGQLRRKMIDYQMEILKILTPDQIRKWCTLVGGGAQSKGWKRWQ